ncbi:unnamed protein product [Amoebophrya sp. A25]|nr:unnamed protein product [Amoebophrya sp. A25]|eukprot:GSA25T00024990001.1
MSQNVGCYFCLSLSISRLDHKALLRSWIQSGNRR